VERKLCFHRYNDIFENQSRRKYADDGIDNSAQDIRKYDGGPCYANSALDANLSSLMRKVNVRNDKDGDSCNDECGDANYGDYRVEAVGPAS
jgi:hypothetical protein